MLDISDNVRYRLADMTLGNRSVSFRRQQATSPYLPGTWTISAVPDTISENVGVYVYGTSNAELRLRLDQLTDCFSQLNYFMSWENEDDSYIWMCQVADYQVDTRREFQHATMALCTFEVPRYPALLDAIPTVGSGSGGL